MQETSTWTPPTGVLGRILGETAARVRELRSLAATLDDRAAAAPPAPSFAGAISAGDHVAIIGEIKRMSPSKGAINHEIDAQQQAAAYARGGAAALSVLTEPVHFGGSAEDLSRVADTVPLPIVRKDFCIDSLQLLEARALGASAALIIARALPPGRIVELAEFAIDIGLDALVEVRNERELDTALRVRDAVIGVNNRDLETLEINRDVSRRIIPLIPSGRVVVYESGIQSREDVESAATTGADAVLVGSALSAAPDPAAMVRSLTGVNRSSSARGG